MLEIADDVEPEEQIDDFQEVAPIHRFSKCPFEDLECQVGGGKEPAETMLICALSDQGYHCECIGLLVTESPNVECLFALLS